MKYDRLLRITALIDYIASVPGKNYQYYADKFDVSTRTIRRDVKLLGEAGLPIETSAGLRFINDVTLPELDFSYKEAFAVMIALGEVTRYTKFEGALEQVKEKIAQVLPEQLQKVTEEIEKRVGIYPSTVNVAYRSSDKLNLLLSCLINDRKVKIKYKSYRSREVKWRKVAPYGLFFRRRDWYLAAFCYLREEVRTFRLSRIEDWEHLDEYFEFPEEFELEEYVTKSWELMKGEPEEIEVKFAPEVAQLIKEARFNLEEEKEELADGSISYRAEVKGWREVYFWILSFGAKAEIIAPEWLREKARQEAEGMLEVYT